MTTPQRTGTCSLTVTINGVDYAVKPRHRDAQMKVYLLIKDTETRYVLQQTANGECSCSCPDARYRDPVGGCKHVRSLKALWLFN